MNPYKDIVDSIPNDISFIVSKNVIIKVRLMSVMREYLMLLKIEQYITII